MTEHTGPRANGRRSEIPWTSDPFGKNRLGLYTDPEYKNLPTPDPEPIVIGLGGLKTAGKDVVADTLVERLGFKKIGMSDALHEMLMVLNPQVNEVNVAAFPELPTYSLAPRWYRYRELAGILGYVRMKEIPEVRRLQQTFGTDVMRGMVHEDIWTDIMVRKATEYLEAGQSVVVTGIRFRNELEAIEDMEGGHTVWVERPGLTSDGHASESSLSRGDFEHEIFNEGTLADLVEDAADFPTYLETGERR